MCKGIGNLCQGISECCTLPFRMCGVACDGCCRALGQVFGSPFSPYLITTLALNIPPIAWTFLAISGSGSNGVTEPCSGDVWLYVNAMLCLGHIFASFYIVYQVARQEKDSQGTARADASMSTPAPSAQDRVSRALFFWKDLGRDRGNNTDLGSAYSCRRLNQVMCYDVIVAIYILVACFWVIWQFLGVSQAVGSDADSDWCDSIQNWITLSITCGFIYCFLVCIVFSCSFCCLKSS